MNRKKLLIRFSVGLMALLLLANTAYAELKTSVSQYGITWTFSAPAECGQFVNGDWWVVGPVTISTISPAPRVALATEVNDLGTNIWGDTGLQDNTSRRNGSMVVMAPGAAQGYDSRGKSYDASTSITFPYALSVNRSLISSISNDTIPNQQLFHELIWSSEKNGLQVMKTAAVLTCLSTAPPADAFRPTYIGGNKTIYTLSQIHWEKLLNLTPTASMPSWSQFERYFEHPWIDHLNGDWRGQWLLPIQNQASYGREFARMVSMASLMLHTNASQAQKQKLLIGLVQYGIDIHGIAKLGGNWNAGGGHTSGRKWPVVFAGLMLDDENFFDMPSTAVFHEDVQTYYGDGWAGQTALWQMIIHHGVRLPYMHINPSQWSTYDSGWGDNSESYRTCCTIRTWPGQALSALLMSAKSVWNHNAFFDNVEDWMRQEDFYAANRGAYPRPGEEGTTYPPYDNFVTEMWLAYRNSVPAQPDGTTNLMWNASTGAWVSNNQYPSVPNGLTATNITGTSFTLSWNASTDDAGVTGYNVYKNATLVTSVTGTSANISGLTVNNTYKMIVRAKDAGNRLSSPSSTLNVTTFDGPPDTEDPSVPSGLTVGTVTTNSVALSWTASTDNIGVAGYKVYINGSNPQNAAGTSTTITGLADDTQYTFTVSAYDGAGNESAQSSSVNATTYEITSVTSNSTWQSFTESTQTSAFTATFDITPNGAAIDAVTGILNGTASVYDDVACIVRFSTSGQIDARNGGSYTSDNTVNYSSGTTYHFRLEIDVPSHTYSVYVTPQGQSEITLASDFAFRTAQQNVTQLTGWALYAFVPSHTVDNVTFSTAAPDTEAPSVPTSLAAGTVTTNSVDLSWNASTDNIDVTGYKVYVNGTNPISVTGTSTTVSGLTDATSYTFTVSAVDAASNESAQSGSVNATTLDGTAPGIPTGLASSNITTSSVDLSWNASTDNVGVTGYKVYTNGANPLSVTGTSTTISGLSASTPYNFSVSAMDAASNESAQSSAIQVTTATPPDTEAPSVPTGLASGNITTTSFTLSWTTSTDNVGVTGYDVFKNGALETSVTSTSANITGLTAATSYSMTVKAKDAADNISAASSALNVTTASGAPVTSNATWQSFPISTQTGTFTATFDITPNGSSIDGVTGILNGTASVYDDLACIVRFNTSGQIDARNGGSYTSDNTVNYSSGTTYHFRLEINVSSHTYSVYVTPQGQSEVTLASNFAFRTAQQNATQLTGWALYAYVPSHTVSNMVFTSGSNANVSLTETLEPSVKIYPNPLNSTVLNVKVIGYNTDKVNIVIYDMTGRTVYNKAHSITEQTEITIPASKLRKGIYIISVNGSKQKLIVE